MRHRTCRLPGIARGHKDEVRHRRDVPAQRTGRVLRADPGRDEGLLHVHQHASRCGSQARRRRQANRLEVLRRRVQPRQHGAADAQARRGGQGLRHLRRTRHGAAAGGGRLHERAQGAAAARLHRRDGVRSEVPARGRTRSAGSRTTSPRAGSTASTRRRTGRRRRSPSSTRTTTTARTTSRASGAASGRRRRTSSRRRASPPPTRASLAGRGGPPVRRRRGRDLRHAEPDGEGLRDDEGAQVQARAGDPQLGLGERLRHGPRARQLRRDDTRRDDQHRRTC